MSASQRDLLVTAALPYANGPIHLGHLVEYVQADIFVRFQRLRGHQCLFVCGDDAHGTAIMLTASQRNITPESLIQQIQQEHASDLAGFLVEFDNFYTTHSEENRKLSSFIYEQLKTRGDISESAIIQAFDSVKNIFLPDRYIRGTCPKCHTANQYGDNCEACGTTYSPMDLKDPVSALSGTPPVPKESQHFFFHLEHYQDFLWQWLHEEHMQPAVRNKLKEWFGDGLKPWDITRDAPYFGFEIPNAPGKYFYVWLDAPIGYMASLKNLCEKNPSISFDHYWSADSQAELIHFIGKDIVYFHALFWPALLKGAQFRTPSFIHVHGYLTINGQKMSKSRGTFITARRYLDALNPEHLRYYLAAKLTPHVEDIDLNAQDFVLRVNSDLVGKYVNIASRCASFIHKYFNGQLSDHLPDTETFQQFIAAEQEIAEHYNSLNYNKALRETLALSDKANQYIDQMKPWALAKDPEKLSEVQAVCTQGLNLFRLLTLYLKPVLPQVAQQVEKFLNIAPLTWDKKTFVPLLNHTINPFEPLMQRIPQEAVDALFSTVGTA